MIVKLLRLEWSVAQRERSLWINLAVLCGLCLYGLWNGHQSVQDYRAVHKSLLAEEQIRYDSLRAQFARIAQGQTVRYFLWDANNADYVGRMQGQRYALLPSGDLQALSVGQSDLYPSALKVGLTRRDALDGSPQLDSPFALHSGRLDLAFVLLYILPLCILALTYGLLPAERSSGTLRMALLGRFGISLWLLAKLMVRALPLTAGALMMVLLGGLAFGGSLVSLLQFAGAVMLYSIFWVAIAALINALGRTVAGNAIAAAGAWLGLLVVTPALLNLALSSAHPLPTRAHFVSKMREASLQVSREQDTLLARYYQDHPELAPDSADVLVQFGLRSMLARDRMSEVLQPTVQEYDAKLDAQQGLARWVQFLCPPLVVHGQMMLAAGTGTERQQAYRQQVLDYHQAWKHYFEPRIIRSQKLSAEELAQVPSFRFQEPSRARAALLIDVLYLLALVVGLCVWTHRRLSRAEI